MTWTYGGVRIYIQNYAEGVSQSIARLNPLNAGTVLHRFGYDSEVIKLKGIIITNDDRDTIKGYGQTNTAYTLSGPEGVVGTYYTADVKLNRLPSACHSYVDRPELAGTEPEYDCSLELFINE